MKKTTKSTLLLTAATRHSQDLVNNSNFKTRSRINLFATTGETQLKYKPTFMTNNPEEHTQANGMKAKMAKMSFDCQMLL